MIFYALINNNRKWVKPELWGVIKVKNKNNKKKRWINWAAPFLANIKILIKNTRTKGIKGI